MRDYRLPRSHKRSRVRTVHRSRSRRSSSPKQGPSWLSRFSSGLVIAVVILGLVGVAGYGLLSQVIPRLLPLKENSNLVLVASEKYKTPSHVFVLHFRPTDQKLIVAKIQADQSVPVIGGFGQYPLRSVWPLLQMEKKPAEFNQAAFSYGLGEIIQGIGEAPDAMWDTQPDKLKTSLVQALRSQKFTSLSVKDQLILFLYTTQLSTDKIEVHEVSSLEKWADVRQQLTLAFPEPECSVAVVNTTSQAGLASTISQVIEQTGYPVIRVTDSKTNLAKTHIFYATEPTNCSVQAESISQVVPFEVEIAPDTAMTQLYRASIVVEVGQDVSQVAP